jgi:hypothetical protein
MSDESQVAVGPFERMSLNEAFIILGITGNPDAVTDEAIVYSYDHLVFPVLTLLTIRRPNKLPDRKNSKKPSKSLPITETASPSKPT